MDNFFALCERCNTRKLYVAKRKYLHKVTKTIESKARYCNKCHSIMKKMIDHMNNQLP